MVRISFIFPLLFSALFSMAQTNNNLYTKQWKEIDSLISKQSLSKTALAKVNLIYKQAKEKDQQVQVIKR